MANTPKLDLLLIQASWQFADEAFNRVIRDMDDKLLGVAHLNSPKHWSDWKPTTEYAKYDVVRITQAKSHQYYQCVVGGTSGTAEPTNNVTGSQVTDGTITWEVMSLTEVAVDSGVLRIWLSGAHYYRGEAVLYGQALYRCRVEHTATNWTDDNLKWQEVYASLRIWTPNIFYFVGDSMVYNNLIYQCITEHVSGSSFNATEKAKWKLIGSAGGAENWKSSTYYLEGQLIDVNGILYRANQEHTSTTSFAADIAKWDKVCANIKEWEASVYYPQGTLVHYDDMLYVSNTTHTSSSTFEADGAKWTLYLDVIKKWQQEKYYHRGRIITYQDALYRCIESHFAANTSLTPLDIWKPNTAYTSSDVVLDGTVLYKCIQAHTSQTGRTDDADCWQVFADLTNAGATTWQADTLYLEGQSVVYANTTFICNTAHQSSLTSMLDDIAYWSVYLVSDAFSLSKDKWELIYAAIYDWKTEVTYKRGTTVVYGNAIYKCVSDHVSSTFSADASHWKMIGSASANIFNWEPNTNYYKNNVIYHNGIVYRAKQNFTSNEQFSDEYLEEIIRCRVLDWQPNTYYNKDDVVVNGTSLIRCTIPHTSESTYSVTEKDNWIEIGGGGGDGLKDWYPNTQYEVGNTVIYNNNIYRCNTTHTSGATFVQDVSKWDLIGGGGGTSHGFSQVTKYNTASPMQVDIPRDTLDFCFPSLEVLKFTQGQSGVTVNQFTFSAGDGSSFLVDGISADENRFVKFDGTARLNDRCDYTMTNPVQFQSGYISFTEEDIDFTEYKSVSAIEMSAD